MTMANPGAPNTGEFANEVVDDICGEFRGSASLDDLEQWFGEDRERIWRTLERLIKAGRVTKIGTGASARYYASASIRTGKAA